MADPACTCDACRVLTALGVARASLRGDGMRDIDAAEADARALADRLAAMPGGDQDQGTQSSTISHEDSRVDTRGRTAPSSTPKPATCARCGGALTISLPADAFRPGGAIVPCPSCRGGEGER